MILLSRRTAALALLGCAVAATSSEARASSVASRPKVLPTLVQVLAQAIPSLAPEGDLGLFRQAIERQIAFCLGENLKETFLFGKKRVTRKKWCVDTGRAFLSIIDESSSLAEVMTQARSSFDWYKSVGRDGKGEVLYTGYYFPSLQGSLKPTERMAYPFYARPSDLVPVTVDGKTVWRRKLSDGSIGGPYDDRRAIDLQSSLKGKGLELVYTSDPLEAFIFHVQGAGAVHFRGADGSEQRMILNFDGANGQPYVSLRKVMKDKGISEEYLTLQGMRRYFKEHPSELMPMLAENPSYVFFKQDADGPVGVKDLVLTPGHSFAIDPTKLPINGIALVSTRRPLGSGETVTGWKDFTRLGVTQDIGGAIQGPGRIDIYWGEDAYAEFAAGQMNNTGEAFFAVVKAKGRAAGRGEPVTK